MLTRMIAASLLALSSMKLLGTGDIEQVITNEGVAVPTNSLFRKVSYLSKKNNILDLYTVYGLSDSRVLGLDYVNSKYVKK